MLDQCGLAVCVPPACECAVSTSVVGLPPSTSSTSSSGGQEPSWGSSQKALLTPAPPASLAFSSK